MSTGRDAARIGPTNVRFPPLGDGPLPTQSGRFTVLWSIIWQPRSVREAIIPDREA